LAKKEFEIISAYCNCSGHGNHSHSRSYGGITSKGSINKAIGKRGVKRTKHNHHGSVQEEENDDSDGV